MPILMKLAPELETLMVDESFRWECKEMQRTLSTHSEDQ